mmetsp:Transcript_24987/g.36684  ORF Transcript_24987/g.36684 Transcript_24987/m.36684 type:complete len:305 (-) Transcript_24987:408-1322(-)|eukprot:CAMPEP_0195510790 /NCGR_PEP_ID=MMETSP0794_2-20130614/3330_1 /TAXON_ID=515487 /ORGANISM="Stephanopyxis turris, Strain CCMP 815" /LENGTH=304 /DNA_ID=CAMNT_0040638277 /DNA_START=22 /DNA_END=936 /DNA_ORIENTATION=+
MAYLSQHAGQDSDAKESGDSSSAHKDSFSSEKLRTLISNYDFPAAQALMDSVKGEEQKQILASMPDEYGDLPLHMSIKRSAPEDFILSLLDAFEESVTITAGNGMKTLPLHLAVIHCASPRIIVTLIRRYPESLDAVDEDGDTPRACVRRNLDPVAKDALIKPTEYWTTLLGEIGADAEKRAKMQLAKKIALLEQQLRDAKAESDRARLMEDVYVTRIKQLETRVAELEHANPVSLCLDNSRDAPSTNDECNENVKKSSSSLNNSSDTSSINDEFEAVIEDIFSGSGGKSDEDIPPGKADSTSD